LPGANVRLTRTAQEVDAWLKGLHEPSCVLAAGGDGTAIALVNALRRVYGQAPFPRIGILPLGTGNAWAHATGAPKLHECLRRIAALPTRPSPHAMMDLCHAHGEPSVQGLCPAEVLPMRRFGLVECEGVLTHFAGAGWDAQILNDYRTQVAQSKGPSRWVTKSVYGYVLATLTRTAPKAILFGRPHVIVENLGDDVYTMTADRKLIKIHGAKHGTVLYDGPASVAGCSTSPELGYGFRAFPFAERMLGHMNVRIYDEGPVGAVLVIPNLWRGQHPLRGMHDWFATAVRMTFSRSVPVQIGGDAVGSRQTLEYRIADREVMLLDWRGFD
jgi:diacylglycerol kinase family enzyme